MSHSFDLSQSLGHFSGRAPLFPLPDVSFYPHVLLPLHIFEPRYRRMAADAIEDDRFIAMATLGLGWELAGEEELPPIYPHVCLGRIVAEERLPDGRYFLMLQGVARAQVIAEETNDDLPYRVGQLELRPDRVSPMPMIDRDNRRRELLEAFRDLYPRFELNRLLHEVLDPVISLSLLCDVIASVLKLSPEQSQEILAEEDVDARSDIVLMRLRSLRRKQRAMPVSPTFPPDFSAN